jgi:hypothetical protein
VTQPPTTTTNPFSSTLITAPPSSPTQTPPPPARRAGGRGLLVAAMVTALVAAGMTRGAAVQYKARATAAASGGAAVSRSALGGMNSFALALLLGGLRGPLVMVLWSSSENQKVEKNLEDFNTKVEWIRMLQPEFDSVHMFQIWNLAYNISVQMASLPNRYAVILEALDYARSVERSRPDNLNILHQAAQVYSNKLGTVAQERTYYRNRVRQDSFSRPQTGPKAGDAGFQRRRMDPLLDENFRIRKEFLVARHPRPAALAEGAEWNTGEELQFLPQFEPYPEGVSTYALAYNYSKRAEVIMNASKQKPLQLSESVIDSRPALELKAWAEEDWERGRAFELKLYGLPAPKERFDMEAPTQVFSLERPFADPQALDRALYSYRNASRIAAAARAEYQRHLVKFFDKLSIYQSHIEAMEGIEQLTAADADYLDAARTTDPAARTALLRRAAAAYRKSVDIHELTILRYYVEDDVANKFYGVRKPELAMLSAEKRRQILAKVAEASALNPNDTYVEDRAEYLRYTARARARLQLIGQ